MLLDFTINNKKSNWFESRGNLTIDKLHLDNVRYHTHCIGLLQLFGKIESISLGDKMIHLNKASLIKRYRSIVPREAKSSDTTIINLIRLIYRAQSTHHQTPLISALDLYKPCSKRSQNRNFDYLDLAQQQRPIDVIESSLKEALRQMSGAELHNAIQDQFKMVHLMGADGRWKDSAFTKNHDLLIPSEATAWERCYQLIDQTIAAAKKNPYLLAAIDHLNPSQLQTLREKIKLDGMSMMKYLIPYAFALNGLTSLLAKDINLFDRVDALFSREKRIHYPIKYLNIFGMIKYYTVGRLSKLTQPIKTNRISKDHCRHYLNLNIMEAVVADWCLGNIDNAKAGWTLIQHPVGGKAKPPRSGPASIGTSRGYPVMQLYPDFPKQWADLYALWNLAFCSNASNFPIIATKLLIPSVNDYASHPSGYIFHRGIALYLHFQFALFRNLNGEPPFLKEWDCMELTRAMGRSAAASAQKYLAQFNSEK